MTENKLYLLQPVPVGKIIEFDLLTSCSRIVVDNLNTHPDGIAVDTQSSRIYWTNMGPHIEKDSFEFFEPDGSVETCSLDGSQRKQLVGNGAFVTGKQLVHDKNAGYLYWCDREGLRVFRADEDGGNLTVLVQTGVFPQNCRDYTLQCVGIAVDTNKKYLYWTQKGPSKGGKGRILRANLDLPEGATVANRPDIEVLLDDLPEPIDLELTPDGNTLYWTDRGDDACGGNSLNKADIIGNSLVNHQILASGFNETIALAIDHVKDIVYISDLGGNLYQHTLSIPGSKEILAKFGPLTGITLAK